MYYETRKNAQAAMRRTPIAERREYKIVKHTNLFGGSHYTIEYK